MSKSDTRKRQRTASGDSDSDSDYDQPSSKKTYADGYDENYHGDADDRAWLKTLSEREREAELLKRHEQREIMKRREEINKRLKSKAEESGMKSEEEGEIDDPDDDSDDGDMGKPSRVQSNLYDNDIYDDDNDDEDDYRSSANRRKQINESKQKKSEHSKSLQVLAERRRKKQDELNRRSAAKLDDDSSSDDDTGVGGSTRGNEKDEIWKVGDVYKTSSSENDDDDDDDDSLDRSGRRRLRSRSPEEGTVDSREQESKRKRCTQINTRDQLKSMILSRFRMEKWCHAPFFAEVAKGAFVRINIGQNNGQPVYRICEIQEVVETGKIYNLGVTRTNKGLRLKHANNERIFRLEYVSNHEISDVEFQRWKEAMMKQGVSLPTLDVLDEKMKAIDKYKNYVYKNEDITKIVEEKKRFRKVPINYAMTKNELLKEINIAKDENDTERENDLRKRLDEMEKRAAELDQKRSESISVMAQINRRNRQNTQKNIELALTREAQEHRNAASDPFTRRRCAPTLVTKTPQVNNKEELIRTLQQERRAAESAAESKKKAEEQTTAGANSKTATTKTIEIPIHKQTMPEKSLSSMATHERGSFTSLSNRDDDIFASHDFELDLTIKLFPD